MKSKTGKYDLFDLLVGEDFETKDGKGAVSWTKVGAVFRNAESGAITGKITPGLALTGKFIIKARDSGPKKDGQEAAPGADL